MVAHVWIRPGEILDRKRYQTAVAQPVSTAIAESGNVGDYAMSYFPVFTPVKETNLSALRDFCAANSVDYSGDLADVPTARDLMSLLNPAAAAERAERIAKLIPGLIQRHFVRRPRVAVGKSGSEANCGDRFKFPSGSRCFKRAPGPPPFSSSSSTPAVSKALRMAAALASVMAVLPLVISARWMVARLTRDMRARSATVHRKSARAALI
jgi:hypothetical protein